MASIKQIRAFLTVTETGSFTRSAERLFVTQPALTRAIKNFEVEMGVRLFVRGTRSVALTRQGERFLPVAQRLVKEFDSAVADLHEESKGYFGNIHIATGAAFACAMLPAILRDFSRDSPRVKVKIEDANSVGIVQMVNSASIDFGIASLSGDVSRLATHRLLTARLGLLFAPGTTGVPRFIAVNDLGKYRVMRFAPDTSIAGALNSAGMVDSLAGKLGGVEVSSSAVELAMVEHGLGQALVSGLTAMSSQARGFVFVPLAEPEVVRELYLCYRSDLGLSAQATGLARAIVDGIARIKLPEHIALAPNVDL